MKKLCCRKGTVVLFFLAVKGAPDFSFCEHAEKVNNPYNPAAEEDTEDCSNYFSFACTGKEAEKPCCKRNDCKNKAEKPAESKVVL